MIAFSVLLFPGFETLDAVGPVDIIGHLPQFYEIHFYSPGGGLVKSAHGVEVLTESLATYQPGGVLLVPGGLATRQLVVDPLFLQQLKKTGQKSMYLLGVCTGSVLLAAAGFLNNKKATSNKNAFAWAQQIAPQVKWQKKARWVKEKQIYTSSGVTAGMDMTLGFLADLHGMAQAEAIARAIEYIWHADKDDDPFALEEN